MYSLYKKHAGPTAITGETSLTLYELPGNNRVPRREVVIARCLPNNCPAYSLVVFIFVIYVDVFSLQHCNPMNCSLPGSSVHKIFQARILEQVAISFSGDLHNPGIEPGSPTL